MENETVSLLKRLIQIDSTNPPGKEKQIALFISRFLREQGVPGKTYEYSKDRPNIVGYMPSRFSRKKLIITPHIDTVPVTGKWKAPPFSGRVINGKVYGRGATDDKVNVAVLLSFLKLMKERGVTLKNLDLIAAFTADEETGSRAGIIPLLKSIGKIDYGIVMDTDDFEIIIAQKGLLHLRVEITGKEAHGAFPGKGINAVERAMSILSVIRKEKFFKRKHPLLDYPTLNIGRLHGGDLVNVVPGFCFFEIDIRYIPGMTAESIIGKVREIIKNHHCGYKLKVINSQPPIEIEKAHFLTSCLARTLRKSSLPVNYKGSMGATVISFLSQRKIESLCFGAGSKGQAHTAGEYVRTGNVVKGVDVLFDYVRSLDEYLDKKTCLRGKNVLNRNYGK